MWVASKRVNDCDWQAETNERDGSKGKKKVASKNACLLQQHYTAFHSVPHHDIEHRIQNARNNIINMKIISFVLFSCIGNQAIDISIHEYALRDPLLFGDYRNMINENEPRFYEDLLDYEAIYFLFQEVLMISAFYSSLLVFLFLPFQQFFHTDISTFTLNLSLSLSFCVSERCDHFLYRTLILILRYTRTSYVWNISLHSLHLRPFKSQN